MALRDHAKRKIRMLITRAAAPYVAQIQRDLRTEVRRAVRDSRPKRPPAPAAATAIRAVPTEAFHQLNHELRTIAFERPPQGFERAVSIGASGRWYFDWFEHCVGPVKEHVGVEAFEPKPDDLPEYVRWVENTADHLDDVEDNSADVVFAGQTTEHLWAHELTGFLLEAHRVLRTGGVLIMDSPNRLVTEQLRWSHGGHTVELSLAEINELAVLAGFRPTVGRGIWHCRVDGRVLELEEGLDRYDLVARRVALAETHPDDSFIWWVEAERLDIRPDRAALAERVEQMFEQHWSTRASRGMWPGPPLTTRSISAGCSGVLVANLPIPLHAGTWELALTFEEGSPEDVRGLAVEIVAPGNNKIHHLPESAGRRDGGTLVWSFQQMEPMMFALTIRVLGDQVLRPVALRMPVDLRSTGHPAAPARGGVPEVV